MRIRPILNVQGLWNRFVRLAFDHTKGTYKYDPKENMLVAPAAERNKEPILDVLKQYLPTGGTPAVVFEVASGTGQHVCHFAPHFPNISWLPSDREEKYVKSIRAHLHDKQLKNVLRPINVDITDPVALWATPDLRPDALDMILNINMVHISPWGTAVSLFKVAGMLLGIGGILFMYGPFKVNGVLTPESNVEFDKHLRSQDYQWGIRDVVDLDKLAEENGLERINMVDMPANNKCIIFKKVVDKCAGYNNFV